MSGWFIAIIILHVLGVGSYLLCYSFKVMPSQQTMPNALHVMPSLAFREGEGILFLQHEEEFTTTSLRVNTRFLMERSCFTFLVSCIEKSF